MRGTIAAQHGRGKGGRAARVRKWPAGIVCVLGRPPPSHRVEELGVPVVDEIGKGGHLAVLLAHEQEGCPWRQEQEPRHQVQTVRGNEGREASSVGAVPDLVMVLDEGHETIWWDGNRRCAVAALAEPRILALVHKALIHRPGHVVSPAVVTVVAAPFACHDRMDRVVEIVAPLRIHAEAVTRQRRDGQRIVVGALGNEAARATETLAELLSRRASSARKVRALRSMSSCTASRRRASTWKSSNHC